MEHQGVGGMNKVYDPESTNFCDRCGVEIAPGEIYLTTKDDGLMLCQWCNDNSDAGLVDTGEAWRDFWGDDEYIDNNTVVAP